MALFALPSSLQHGSALMGGQSRDTTFIINADKDVGRKVWLRVSVYFCVCVFLFGCDKVVTDATQHTEERQYNVLQIGMQVCGCVCVCASTTPPLSYFLSLVPCMAPSNCCTPLSHLSMTHVCVCVYQPVCMRLIVSLCVVTCCAVTVLPGVRVLIRSSFRQNLTGLCAPDINTCTHTDAQVDE